MFINKPFAAGENNLANKNSGSTLIYQTFTSFNKKYRIWITASYLAILHNALEEACQVINLNNLFHGLD